MINASLENVHLQNWLFDGVSVCDSPAFFTLGSPPPLGLCYSDLLDCESFRVSFGGSAGAVLGEGGLRLGVEVGVVNFNKGASQALPSNVIPSPQE